MSQVTDTIRLILSEYLPVRRLNDKNRHALKGLVTGRLVNELKLAQKHNFVKIKGHVRQGLWADAPWVGFHDSRIDSKPQTGVYCVIIFAVDGSSVAISMQHGTDKIARKQAIDRVTEIQGEFVAVPNGFSKQPLKLGAVKPSSRPAQYQLANIIGKQYDLQALAGGAPFLEDLQVLLGLYEGWALKIRADDDEESYQNEDEDDEVDKGESMPPPRLEDTAKRTRAGTNSPPRDTKEGIRALKKAKYYCEADKTHRTFPKRNGTMYMEKHHLVPMEKYYDFCLSIDHHSNIYSLCPTCHRLIHHGRKSEKDSLIKILYEQRKDVYAVNYQLDLNKIKAFYR